MLEIENARNTANTIEREREENNSEGVVSIE